MYYLQYEPFQSLIIFYLPLPYFQSSLIFRFVYEYCVLLTLPVVLNIVLTIIQVAQDHPFTKMPSSGE